MKIKISTTNQRETSPTNFLGYDDKIKINMSNNRTELEVFRFA